MYGPPVDLSFKNINCLAGSTLHLYQAFQSLLTQVFISCVITITLLLGINCTFPVMGQVYLIIIGLVCLKKTFLVHSTSSYVDVHSLYYEHSLCDTFGCIILL